jgi:hypothetical protein
MTRPSPIVALAVMLTLAGVGATAAARPQPTRTTDQQVEDLLTRMDADIDTFRSSLDRAIDRHPINGTRAEDDIDRAVKNFTEAADRLKDRAHDRQAGTADAEDVLRRASVIDAFMTANTLDTAAERDWQTLRGELDQLARAYGVAPGWTGPQYVKARASDRQVKDLLARTRKDADRFRKSLDKALDRSRLDGSREEDDIDRFVTDFAETTDHLSDHFNRHQVVTSDVDEVLRRGVSIDRFMQRQQLAAAAENDWLTVRRDLDQLAQAFNVPWNWNSPTYTSDERSPGIYRHLTGTYQLDRGRGDDPRRAAEQATRALPSNQRQAVSQRLMERLSAPETLAIDRNDRTVTLASSSGRPVTFEADGTIRAERGYPGGTANTRATLFGDQLMVTTTGTGGSDYQVTFEPLADGRELQVTRRILDDSLRQPVTVQSFYRRSSAEARWDVYSAAERYPAPYGSPGFDAVVPDGTRLLATLDTALSTRTAQSEDRFTITTRSPSQYEGAVIAGTVSSANASDRLSGRAEMTLSFETIRMRDGRSYPFAGTLETIRTPDGETLHVESGGMVEDDSQTAKTVERSAIGAAVGAIVGAISGGGKGAAIGAAIGAGGGAGTVIVQGRDQLDLDRGTELTIISTRARRPTSR